MKQQQQQLKPEALRNWMPVRVYWQENCAFVDWCYMGETRFTEPFFDQTIERCFREPFSLLFRHQTPIEFLGELNASARREILAPSGFIFHLSRCGSTLVSQMLAATGQTVVLSEPPPVDSVLRANFKNPEITDERRIEWLQWIIGALGRKRNDAERHYFIKFDSWSTLEMALIGRAFPAVPWIFLYRNPVEVIASHLKQRGAQMIPGVVQQILPGLNLTDVLQMSPEEYCARVLAQICEAALESLPNRNARLINYTQLPEAVTSIVTNHFRAEYAPEDIEKMRAAAQFNAKTPQMNFVPDSETKKKQASEAAHQAAEKWVNPLYEKLESARRDFAQGREEI
ncbi:MAG: sulfotransferase family protein [Acidobacteriota bacterium]|nr:sulfotransferase family protein [Acidobacteriota bacterium]